MYSVKVTLTDLSKALTKLAFVAACLLAFNPQVGIKLWQSAAVRFTSDPNARLQQFGRVWLPRTKYPYSAVGQVIQPRNKSQTALCSGTLISPCHVLTARHCIDQETKIYFAHSKDVYTEAKVVARGEGDVSHDWAILEIQKPFGHRFGWMRLARGPLPAGRRDFEFAGLPSAITSLAPSLKRGIRDLEVQFDELERDFKLWTSTRLSNGDSGGALWTMVGPRPVIVGSAVRGLFGRDGSYFFPAKEAALALESLNCSGGVRP